MTYYSVVSKPRLDAQLWHLTRFVKKNCEIACTETAMKKQQSIQQHIWTIDSKAYCISLLQLYAWRAYAIDWKADNRVKLHEDELTGDQEETVDESPVVVAIAKCLCIWVCTARRNRSSRIDSDKAYEILYIINNYNVKFGSRTTGDLHSGCIPSAHLRALPYLLAGGANPHPWVWSTAAVPSTCVCVDAGACRWLMSVMTRLLHFANRTRFDDESSKSVPVTSNDKNVVIDILSWFCSCDINDHSQCIRRR